MTDCITAAARFLASEPAAVVRALRRHQRRTDGTCAGCGVREKWPCAIASSALLAQSMLVDRATPGS